MMIQRTPYVPTLPSRMIRKEAVPRTPVVNGRISRHLSELVCDADATDADVEAAIALNDAAPHREPLWEATQQEMMAASCAYYAAETLRGPIQAPYDGRFLLARHHYEWDEHLNTHDRLVELAARDHGKCAVAGSLIQRADGARIPIEDWKGGKLIAYDRTNYSLLPAESHASEYQGMRQCLQVTTRTGRVERVTTNHRFFTADGPVYAQDLKVGERIAVVKDLPLEGGVAMPEQEAWLLGIRGENRAPETILKADRKAVCAYLAGLFDSDGNVNKHGGGACEYYSVSEDLLRDVQHLLTRIGVVAALSPKRGTYKGLTIRGAAIVTFAKHVQLRSSRRKQLQKLAAAIAEVQGNAQLGAIAASPILWDEVVTVDDIGLHPTYGIEVPGHHSYVGQDVVNHNSHWWSLAVPLWLAEHRFPGQIGYLFSATQTLAEDLLKLIRDEVRTNPKLAHLRLKEDGTNRELRLANGSTIKARGFGVRVRGGHPPWIICDDCLSDDDIYSETTRRKNIDFFLSAITNMVIEGGIIIVTGTPMHHADLYAYLRGTGEYKFYVYKAIDRERILFPERYSKERLERRKREIGVARFAREFLCIPLSDEASLFPSRLFEGIRMPYKLGMPAQFWEGRGMLRFTAVDFAMSSSAQADYTVIFTIAVDANKNRWIANIRRGKGWSFQRQLDEIEEEYALMKPQLIFCEANQMQRIFSDELRRTTALPIKKFFTAGVQPKQPWKKGMTTITMGKHHLERGVPRIQLSLENGKWRVPRGDQHSVEMTDVWIGELQTMSFQDGKVISVGEHDDTVMSCWMTEVAADEGGMTFSFGAEETTRPSTPAAPPSTLAVAPAPTAPELPPARAVRSEDDSWRPHEGAPMPWELPGF